MKKPLLLLCLFSIFSVFSQTKKGFDYEKHSKPDSNNELSLYFKNEIPNTLLKNITYQKNISNLIIYFYINRENKPYNIYLNSNRNSKLNSALKKALKNYFIKNSSLSFSTQKKYSFQVISKKGNLNQIVCSSNFISETVPICENCKDLDFYQDLNSCLNKEIRNHLKNSINFSLSNQVENKDDFKINLELSVNKDGFLSIDKIKADNIFNSEINEAVKSFPRFSKPGFKNETFHNFKLKIYLNFKKGKVPKSKKLEIYFDSIFKPNSYNKFAKYLSQNLSEHDIQNANLNRVNDRISIYFEIDKNGNPFEISTNSRSNKLEEKIISLFKSYNLNDLKITDKTKFNRFFTPIILFEKGKKIIKTDSIIGFSRSPIISGCKKVATVKEARKCFSRQVQIYFSKKFNSKLPNKLGLSRGRKRIFISFKISKKGRITDIVCRAPHKKIQEEVIRVMKKLPKTTPAIFGLEPVDIKYSIPFTLIVE